MMQASEGRFVEGKVAKSEWVNKNGKDYFLVHLYNEQKPVAFGYDPGVSPGCRVGIQVANEGYVWLFPGHRTPAITPPEIPTYKLEEQIPQWKGRAGEVAQIIWAKFLLANKNTVSGDEVFDEITRRFPESDPRIIGLGFQYLSKRGMIHKVGYRKSIRKQSHYHPKEAVWELTRK